MAALAVTNTTNVTRNCNVKNIDCVLLKLQLISIHSWTDVYKAAGVISASMGSTYFL